MLSRLAARQAATLLARASLAAVIAGFLAAALFASCASAPAPAVPSVSADSPLPETPFMAAKRSEEPRGGDMAPEAKGAAAGEFAFKEVVPGGVTASSSRAAPSQSGLKAGFSDDNEQYNLFVKFLEQYGGEVAHKILDVRERILLKVLDAKERPVANAEVLVKAGTRTVAKGRTYSDGGFNLYPRDLAGAADASVYRVEVSAAAGKAALEVDRQGPRSVQIRLGAERATPMPLPVDVLFVMDTTGSMGEEIERLRATIEIIHTNLLALKPRPEIRFGLVLYKDREDEYITEVHPFTANLEAFQKVLDRVGAYGGGDTPEDLQAALKDAVRGMAWNRDGLRLAFIVTDAPPQLYEDQTYDYAAAAREAKEKGIKLYTIGTGGLPLDGEYVLRQIAQYTQAKYIFLTYGEGGESEGGKEGSVSHHTGTNFTTDKLEAVVIRFVKEEISRFSDKPLAYDESFYEANKVADESREDTLGKLFGEALKNLADYSTFRLGPETRLAVMPVSPPSGDAGAALAATAEYFSAQLAQAAAASKLWTVVERKDLQTVLKELELQLSGLVDEEAAAKVGRILGAEVLVSGSVYRRDERYELFLKLVRVETAEVLAATKARIDLKLGL